MTPLSILLLIAALAVPNPGPGARFEESLHQAAEALGKGDPAASLSWLDRALRDQPDSTQALMLLGKTFMALERHDEALAAFDRAAALAPAGSDREVDALYGKADALARLDRNAETVEMLNRVMTLAPDHPGVHHDLARIDLALGRLEDAERRFRAEIALHEKAGAPPAAGSQAATVLASSWEGLGIAAYRAGDDTTALDAFSHAPETVESLYHRGLVLARAGKSGEAADAFRRVLKKEPDHRGALQNLARVTQDPERKDALSRFQTLYTQDVAANRLRIRIRELRTQAEQKAQTGDYAGADALLRAAAALDPGDTEVRMDLGRWRYRAGDKSGSEAMLREVIAFDPMHADAHHLLGRLLGDQGDATGSILELERAVALAPMNAGYHLHLANAFMRARRVEDGLRELTVAQRLAPDDPRTSYNLGLALAQSGDFAGAAAQLDDAVRLGYADPLVHKALAQVHKALGNTERSVQEQATYERLAAAAKGAIGKDGNDAKDGNPK